MMQLIKFNKGGQLQLKAIFCNCNNQMFRMYESENGKVKKKVNHSKHALSIYKNCGKVKKNFF